MSANSSNEYTITELSRVLANLSQENKRLQAENERLNQATNLEISLDATESLTDGIMIFDADKNLQHMNSAFAVMMKSIGINCQVGMSLKDYILSLYLSENDHYKCPKGMEEEHANAHANKIDFALEAEEKITVGRRHYLRRSRPTSSRGRIVTLTDITDLHRANANQTIYSESLDSLTDGVLIYDNQQKIFYFNDAFDQVMINQGFKVELGMKKKTLMTKLYQSYPADYFDVSLEAWVSNAMLQNAIDKHIDEQIPLANKHYLKSSRPIPSGGQIIIMTDVSDMQGALSKAQIAEKSKSEFLANMSHEIRTPMNGIIGMTELLGMTELNSRQQHFVETISKSGEALITIINDILDFSKLEAGQAQLDPTPFSLRDAIEDVTDLLSTSAADKAIELLIRVNPDLPQAMVGDVGRIRQILTNLVGNAIKFTHSGHVLIDVNGQVIDEQAQLTIEIEDTGIGIPETSLGDVFGKFKQVDGTTTREYEGTGLGLTISANLVNLMGGTISAKSTLGQGSTFTVNITLPTHEDVRTKIKPSIDIIGANILIVDDNAVNRDILSEQISHWKCNSVALSSAQKTIQTLGRAKEKNIKIDMIIADYQMPNMNGEELFNILRADPDFADIPYIVLTSVNQDKMAHRMMKNGLDAILTKPARSSLLLNTITECLYKSKNASPRPYAKAPGKGAARADNTEKLASAPDIKQNISDHSAKASSLDVLVAEDNTTNQIYIKYLLEDLGLSYKIVDNGRLAMDSWKALNPKVILMDISMPEMNGYEATHAIRNFEAKNDLPRTPIIAATAHALKEDEQRCLDAGMDDYISKPISVAGLTALLEKWKVMNRSPAQKTA